MTNNPRKYDGLAQYGLDIAERVPLITVPIGENERYLRTKQQVLGHALGLRTGARLPEDALHSETRTPLQ